MGNETSQSLDFGDSIPNTVQLTWQARACENSFPGRDGHSAAALGKKLYIFGGVADHGDGECTESNELLVLDSETWIWSRADPQGDVPPARSCGMMCAVNNKLYVFGGLNRDSGWLEGMYMFDTGTKKWTLLSCSGPSPSPRDKMASAVIGSKIYIFGGFGPKSLEEEEEGDSEDEEWDSDEGSQEGAEFGWFNDLYVFDTDTCTWSNPMQMNFGCPTARAAHSMCSIHQHLVIFGGRDSQSRVNDLHVFDTVSRKWQESLKIKGRQPEPRSFHAAATVGSRMVICGGRGLSNNHFADFHIFDTEEKHWLQPSVKGECPAGRGVHTATVVGEHLLLYGGSSDFDTETQQCKTHYGDVYTVKLSDILEGSEIPESADSRVKKPTEMGGGDVKTLTNGQPPEKLLKVNGNPEH